MVTYPTLIKSDACGDRRGFEGDVTNYKHVKNPFNNGCSSDSLCCGFAASWATEGQPKELTMYEVCNTETGTHWTDATLTGGESIPFKCHEKAVR